MREMGGGGGGGAWKKTMTFQTKMNRLSDSSFVLHNTTL